MTPVSRRACASVLVSSLLFCVACSAPQTPPASLHHIVVCWLKDHGNEEARAKLVAVTKTFSEIPGVASVQVGRALPGDRPIVDTTFDVAIVMTFADEKAMKEYIAHPSHKKAVEEVLEPLARKVVAYNFMSE